MHDAEWETLAVIDGIEALDREDRERLDRHVAAGCAGCRRARARARAAAALLLAVPAPVAPSPQLRERVLAGIAGGAAPTRRSVGAAPQRPSRSTAWRWRSVAAALVVVGLLGFLGRALLLERDERRELQVQLAEAEQRIEALARDQRRALADRDLAARERDVRAEALATAVRERDALASLVEVLGAENLRMLALSGRGAADGAQARAYLAPDSGRVVLLGHALPPAPAGSSYQLWLIHDGQPISAGVFDVDASGRARLETAAAAPGPGDVAVAVTIEPAGGVPAPSGPIVLAPR
jgi:anti-sigma-K factor RskA